MGMSLPPAQIRSLLGRAQEALSGKATAEETEERVRKNRLADQAAKDIQGQDQRASALRGSMKGNGKPSTMFNDPMGPEALLASMKGRSEPTTASEDPLDTVEPTAPASASPEKASKADLLRNEGYSGLAEREDMQTAPMGSTSALSGPGSRRTLTSPARSLERQARRYMKFGREGSAAASALLQQAAGIRTNTPSLRTQGGVQADQKMDTAADNIAQSIVDRSGGAPEGAVEEDYSDLGGDDGLDAMAPTKLAPPQKYFKGTRADRDRRNEKDRRAMLGSATR